MLKALAEHICACHNKAAECREKANEIANAATDVTNSDIGGTYLEMESRWMQLAQSFEFVSSMKDVIHKMTLCGCMVYELLGFGSP